MRWPDALHFDRDEYWEKIMDRRRTPFEKLKAKKQLQKNAIDAARSTRKELSCLSLQTLSSILSYALWHHSRVCDWRDRDLRRSFAFALIRSLYSCDAIIALGVIAAARIAEKKLELIREAIQERACPPTTEGCHAKDADWFAGTGWRH
ncbi:hypothetical protein BS47DRAFT_1344901 [Hydnum rufescens UP504]|uniref:Uncharacterized protein n=1 Tax=Hydnum rufescens UP504 TaxID=1448309 RepID=A0A9P6AVX9_9AGAM|nr:hypothetical protein BS47DRAFT_1344901 [Hydnum rufescens UP504]